MICALGVGKRHDFWLSFFFFFLMWTTFKVFIEFVTILFLCYVLILWPWSMWNLRSPTRDRTHIPFIGRQSLNYWTAREAPRDRILRGGWWQIRKGWAAPLVFTCPSPVLYLYSRYLPNFDKCGFKPSSHPTWLPSRLYFCAPLTANTWEKDELEGRMLGILEYTTDSLAGIASFYILDLFTWFIVFLPPCLNIPINKFRFGEFPLSEHGILHWGLGQWNRGPIVEDGHKISRP